MDWLRRANAPLSDAVWKAIDEAAVVAARQELAARRVADFEGPKGWNHVADSLGTTTPVPPPGRAGVVRSLPDVILLTEIRADFTMPWAAIDAFARGARVMETGPAETAARNVALAEDELAFHGGPGSAGFLTGQVSTVELGDWGSATQVAADLVAAVSSLDRHGVGGPYAAVLEPARFYAYLRAAAERRLSTEADRLEGIITGIHRSAVVTGGALFSLRGGDALLTVGGDLTVGYRWHDATAVHLFCVETIGAHLLNPAAVCVLRAA
jgi:uncharacterized linocin/CFP29 family protein